MEWSRQHGAPGVRIQKEAGRSDTAPLPTGRTVCLRKPPTFHRLRPAAQPVLKVPLFYELMCEHTRRAQQPNDLEHVKQRDGGLGCGSRRGGRIHQRRFTAAGMAGRMGGNRFRRGRLYPGYPALPVDHLDRVLRERDHNGGPPPRNGKENTRQQHQGEQIPETLFPSG